MERFAVKEIAALVVSIITQGSGTGPSVHSYIEQIMPDDKCIEYVASNHWREISKQTEWSGQPIIFAEYSCAPISESDKRSIDELAQ